MIYPICAESAIKSHPTNLSSGEMVDNTCIRLQQGDFCLKICISCADEYKNWVVDLHKLTVLHTCVYGVYAIVWLSVVYSI